jgi:hypothetical protein
MELGGKTFAPPHLPHMFGTLGVNLPYLPHLPYHPNRPLIMQHMVMCWSSCPLKTTQAHSRNQVQGKEKETIETTSIFKENHIPQGQGIHLQSCRHVHTCRNCRKTGRLR